ncbi:MAG: hypothetical protein O3A46_04225 [Candidatus Poribacteria bacterium]|nr:hypothetical protein [Candidatus Poribacteria bacterium]
MATKLEQVLRDIEELTPQERRAVQEFLDALPKLSEEEIELIRDAERRGVFVSMPTRKISVEEYDDYEPIQILSGETVAETIIKERR